MPIINQGGNIIAMSDKVRVASGGPDLQRPGKMVTGHGIPGGKIYMVAKKSIEQFTKTK